MAGIDDDEVGSHHDDVAWNILMQIQSIFCQNELGILEFIHAFVEILDKHFGQVGGYLKPLFPCA